MWSDVKDVADELGDDVVSTLCVCMGIMRCLGGFLRSRELALGERRWGIRTTTDV